MIVTWKQCLRPWMMMVGAVWTLMSSLRGWRRRMIRLTVVVVVVQRLATRPVLKLELDDHAVPLPLHVRSVWRCVVGRKCNTQRLKD